MTTLTSKEVDAAIDHQHPDAGVLVLDARGREGQPRTIGYRERDEEAAEDVVDMVVVLNARPHDDPRSRLTRE